MASRERDVLTDGTDSAQATSRRLVVDGAAERVDRFLARVLPDSSRRHAQALCAAGCVRRDGRRLGKAAVVSAGDVLEVTLVDVDSPAPYPELVLRVVLEREDVVVVDKPAGVPTAAVGARRTGTLAGALLTRYPEMAGLGFHLREPGLLHRLDTFTSGVVAAARTRQAFEDLRRAMESGGLEKVYLALAPPLPKPVGTLESGLGPSGSSRRVSVDPTAPLRRTHYRELLRGPNASLYEVTVGLAYRHQIRVHFANAGAPLLGDTLYGGRPWLETERHALHACTLTLRPQTTGTGFSSFLWRAEAELPSDFVDFLSAEGFDEDAVSRARTL